MVEVKEVMKRMQRTGPVGGRRLAVACQPKGQDLDCTRFGPDGSDPVDPVDPVAAS